MLHFANYTSKYKKSKCAKTHFYRFLRIFYKYKSR